MDFSKMSSEELRVAWAASDDAELRQELLEEMEIASIEEGHMAFENVPFAGTLTGGGYKSQDMKDLDNKIRYLHTCVSNSGVPAPKKRKLTDAELQNQQIELGDNKFRKTTEMEQQSGMLLVKSVLSAEQINEKRVELGLRLRERSELVEKLEKKKKKKSKKSKKISSSSSTTSDDVSPLPSQQAELTTKDNVDPSPKAARATDNVDPSAKAEYATDNVDPSPKAEYATEDNVLAKVHENPMQAVMDMINGTVDMAQKAEDDAERKVKKLLEQKQTDASMVSTLTTRLNSLKATVKKVPSLKPQVDAMTESKRAADRKLAATEVAIRNAIAHHKEMIKSRKAAEKEQTVQQKEADRIEALMQFDGVDTVSNARTIFDEIANQDGVVTRCSMVAGLRKSEEVAAFFKLDGNMKQEDTEGRKQFEMTFGKIAGGGKTFAFDDFEMWCERSKACQV